MQVDPRNIKALALSGTIAFERKDYGPAIGEWRKILAVVPEDSSVATSIKASIADAERKMGSAGAAETTGKSATKVAAAPARISGSVALDPSLNLKVAADDVVFVFAGGELPSVFLKKIGVSLRTAEPKLKVA